MEGHMADVTLDATLGTRGGSVVLQLECSNPGATVGARNQATRFVRAIQLAPELDLSVTLGTREQPVSACDDVVSVLSEPNHVEAELAALSAGAEALQMPRHSTLHDVHAAFAGYHDMLGTLVILQVRLDNEYTTVFSRTAHVHHLARALVTGQLRRGKLLVAGATTSLASLCIHFREEQTALSLEVRHLRLIVVEDSLQLCFFSHGALFRVPHLLFVVL